MERVVFDALDEYGNELIEARFIVSADANNTIFSAIEHFTCSAKRIIKSTVHSSSSTLRPATLAASIATKAALKPMDESTADDAVNTLLRRRSMVSYPSDSLAANHSPLHGPICPTAHPSSHRTAART